MELDPREKGLSGFEYWKMDTILRYESQTKILFDVYEILLLKDCVRNRKSAEGIQKMENIYSTGVYHS